MVKIVKKFCDQDDDSFAYWALSERVPYGVFQALREADAMYFVGDAEEYGGRAGGWTVNPAKAIPVLAKAGIAVENADEVLAKAAEENLHSEQSAAMEKLAGATIIPCPKCGKPLRAGTWSRAAAIMRCYRDKYTVILRTDGKAEDEGFDDERNKERNLMWGWETQVFRRLTYPEEEAKEQLQKAADAEFAKQEAVIRAAKTIGNWKAAGGTDKDAPLVDQPQGEKWENKERPWSICGGGEWYIFPQNISDEIWIIENNGGDGDDWSRNNIRTGGAGAIGLRCKRTAELEAAVKAVAKSEEKS